MSLGPETPPKDDKTVTASIPPSGVTVVRVSPPKHDDARPMLVRRSTLTKLKWGGIALLAVLVLLDLVVSSKAYIGVDAVFGFWAWFSFAACISLIVLAHLIAKLLARKDDYYDDE